MRFEIVKCLVRHKIALTWVMRLLVGSVFIFSGFAKAIDPYGTLYKVEAYANALHISAGHDLMVAGVFGLCCIEFLIGVFVLTGCFRRSSSVASAVVMAFMLPLTLWIAISDPVDDCGCFGDALVISNWGTFWKNVVISCAIAWLFKFNKSVHWGIAPALQWLVSVASMGFILFVETCGYVGQPLIDFRPYKVGEKLSEPDEGSGDIVFIYEKDGVKKEFSETDGLPDENEGWVFGGTRELSPKIGAPSGKTLTVWNVEGDEEMTCEAITNDGEEFLVFIPDIASMSLSKAWQLNSLYEWTQRHGARMVAIAAGTPQAIGEWKDMSMAEYPIYSADDTQINEVVRGNPGVVFTADGTVKWKSTLEALNIDDFLKLDNKTDAAEFGIDHGSVLRNATGIYVAVMAMLVFLSFLPQVRKFYFTRRKEGKAIHDDRVRPEE